MEKKSFYIGFPKSYDEIRYYASELIEGRAVIINMSGLSAKDQEKYRIYMSGFIFAVQGKMEEISTDVLLVVPSTVGLTSDTFIQEGLPFD